MDYVVRSRRRENKQFNSSLSREIWPPLSYLSRVDTLFLSWPQRLSAGISLTASVSDVFLTSRCVFKAVVTWHCAAAVTLNEIS